MILGLLEFFHLAALLGFPPLTVLSPDQAAPLEIEAGEEPWRRLTDAMRPLARQAVIQELAPWYTTPLVSTEAACERLHHWASLGRPALTRRRSIGS